MLHEKIYGMQMKQDIPCASAEEPVIMHDTVLDELKQLLLDFGAASHGEVCTAEEYITIEAEGSSDGSKRRIRMMMRAHLQLCLQNVMSPQDKTRTHARMIV